MGAWRVCRPVIRNTIRIRFKAKSCIRIRVKGINWIRICIKVMRIRSPAENRALKHNASEYFPRNYVTVIIRCQICKLPAQFAGQTKPAPNGAVFKIQREKARRG